MSRPQNANSDGSDPAADDKPWWRDLRNGIPPYVGRRMNKEQRAAADDEKRRIQRNCTLLLEILGWPGPPADSLTFLKRRLPDYSIADLRSLSPRDELQLLQDLVRNQDVNAEPDAKQTLDRVVPAQTSIPTSVPVPTGSTRDGLPEGYEFNPETGELRDQGNPRYPVRFRLNSKQYHLIRAVTRRLKAWQFKAAHADCKLKHLKRDCNKKLIKIDLKFTPSTLELQRLPAPHNVLELQIQTGQEPSVDQCRAPGP